MLRGVKFPWHILKVVFESKMAFINSSSFSQNYLMAVYPVLSYFCLSSRNLQQSSIEDTKLMQYVFFGSTAWEGTNMTKNANMSQSATLVVPSAGGGVE